VPAPPANVSPVIPAATLPQRPLVVSQVLPASAVVTLNTLSSGLDAARARFENDSRTRSTFAVEIEKKFAMSVACVVFVILGAPVALRFPRGGVGLVIGVSFAVFGLYYVGLIAGQPLAENGSMSPFWAMWASNVVFTIAGLVLLARVGRSGSTSRGGELGEFLDAVRGRFVRFVSGRRPKMRANRAP
jgi:lipopolysaccharide export system permease protein